MKRTAIRRRRRSDPVTPALRLAVLERDGGCVAVRVGADPGDCRGRLTLDHVKVRLMFGRKEGDHEAFLVAMCWAQNEAVPDKWLREQERGYLASGFCALNHAEPNATFPCGEQQWSMTLGKFGPDEPLYTTAKHWPACPSSFASCPAR